MKNSSKIFIKLMAVLMVFLFIMPLTLTTKVYAEENNTKEVVLFEGEKSATGSWDPWETLVDIKDMNLKDFEKPFTLEISYEGSNAPYVIFQSWTGGNTWGQTVASYTSKGIAYYSYGHLIIHLIKVVKSLEVFGYK